jgi:UDP-2-acetamido-3-amino-2,3-dideoxy-glucuronate N-acetyltransferase
VVGNPARSIGAVCRCGYPVARWAAGEPEDQDATCEKCARKYRVVDGAVSEVAESADHADTFAHVDAT